MTFSIVIIKILYIMNYSYKTFKHSVLIAFGMFLMFLTQSVSAQTLQSSGPNGNGQTFYSLDQCIQILKTDMLVIEENLKAKGQTNVDLSKSVLNYYTSLINYWAEKLASGQPTSSADIVYALNYFLNVLQSPNSDTQEALTTALTPAQAQAIKAETIEKITH